LIPKILRLLVKIILKLADSLFLLQALKLSADSIKAALVCSKCDEAFQKDFPLDLEGQTVEFKCPICGAIGEADIPYNSVDERERIKEGLEEDAADEEAEEIEYSA
jgi:hypothetical protein